MRVYAVLSTLGLLPATAVQAAAAKIDIKDAASLIGKTIDEDTQYATGSDARRLTAGDWTYGFEVDDPGLVRSASSKERGKGEALLATAMPYNQRCKRSEKNIAFTFGGDERFPLKGSVAKGRRADAWIFVGTAAAFDQKPVKVNMAFSENDGALRLKLDPAQMARHGQIALCPTAALPDPKTTHCAIFSLAGFARAYDFACDAR